MRYKKAPDVERGVKRLLGQDVTPEREASDTEQPVRIASGMMRFVFALVAGLSGIFGK